MACAGLLQHRNRPYTAAHGEEKDRRLGAWHCSGGNRCRSFVVPNGAESAQASTYRQQTHCQATALRRKISSTGSIGQLRLGTATQRPGTCPTDSSRSRAARSARYGVAASGQPPRTGDHRQPLSALSATRPSRRKYYRTRTPRQPDSLAIERPTCRAAFPLEDSFSTTPSQSRANP